MNEVDEVSHVEAFAAIIEGRGTGTYEAVTVPLTARLPVESMAWMDVLAAKAGKTRTYVLVQLLDVAKEALESQLDGKTRQALSKAHGKQLRELLESKDQRVERE